jgi:uncharacterized glyoxalase superfamily protein PhnB
MYGTAIGRRRGELVTLALLLDLDVVRGNLALMAKLMKSKRSKLKAHIKVHKSPHLAWDAKVSLGERSATEFSICHNVNSSDEVDRVIKQAANAGAMIVKKARLTFWGGYSCYFQDPDGHLWEAVWIPQIRVED